MAMLMRKPDTSAVSTERLRTWRRSTSGSAKRSSKGIQTASRTTDAAMTPRERAEAQPHASALAEHHRDPDDRQAEQAGTHDVEAPGGARRAGRQDQRGEDQGPGHGDGTEPVGRPEVQELGDQPGHRIAETGPDGGGDRQGGDGPPGLLRWQVPAGDGHGHRQEPEAHALQGPADDQHGEPVGHRRDHAAHDDRAEGDEDDGPLAGPVGQPPHHRRGQGAGQQGDGEDPLPGAQRDPVGPRQGRDEGGAEARHHGHQGSGQHQGRHQEPPAQRRAGHRPRSGPANRSQAGLAVVVMEVLPHSSSDDVTG